METNTKSTRPHPKIGTHKMVSYKMPTPMIEKINRIAARKGINKSMVVRGAIEGIPEGGEA